MTQLILASQSKARQDMLRGAGLVFDVIPAAIDESKVQQKPIAPEQIALELAQQKALTVAQQNPDALVIGSDQVLEFEGKILSKPPTEQAALAMLKAMRGANHRLISAVALARGDQILWSAHDSATLTMQALDDDFLLDYVRRAGPALTASVGGYWLEDIGAWLFEKIDGDYFTILGMPLLPLLNELRAKHGIGWAA